MFRVLFVIVSLVSFTRALSSTDAWAIADHPSFTGQDASRETLPVRSESEQGALGISFHPDFINNRKFYVHYDPKAGAMRSRISEWTLGKGVGRTRKSCWVKY